MCIFSALPANPFVLLCLFVSVWVCMSLVFVFFSFSLFSHLFAVFICWSCCKWFCILLVLSVGLVVCWSCCLLVLLYVGLVVCWSCCMLVSLSVGLVVRWSYCLLVLLSEIGR